MRLGSIEAIFVLGALVFAILLFVEGVSATPSAKEITKAEKNGLSWTQELVDRVDERNGANEGAHDSHFKKREDEASSISDDAENACKAANDAMLAKNELWRQQSQIYESETLPRCFSEWANQVLPSGQAQYRTLECNAGKAWTKYCSDADGMVAVVSAIADFPEGPNTTLPRRLTFPTCFSSKKACTASRDSADYLWRARFIEITDWCKSQTSPRQVCSDVKLTSNFWQVVSLPKIIRIITGVLVGAAVVVVIIIIFVYCRIKQRKQHEAALERTLLLKLARRSAQIQARQTESSPLETIGSSTSLQTIDGSPPSHAAPNAQKIRPSISELSDDTDHSESHSPTSHTPLLRSAM